MHGFFERAQLILLFAGTTPNFAWEMKEVFCSEPFVPALMMIPFFQDYSQATADEFGDLFYASTGHRLPQDLFKVRAAYFPDRNSMVLLEQTGIEDAPLTYFNPFLGAIAHLIDAKIPGWSAEYVDSACHSGINSDGRRSRGSWRLFRRSDLIRAVDTILRPRQAFEGIRYRVNWWVPFLVLFVSSLVAIWAVPTHTETRSAVSSSASGSTEDHDIQAQSPQDKAQRTVDKIDSGLWATSNFEPLATLLYAWIVWVAFKYLIKSQITYAQSLAVTWYAILPWVFHSALWIVLCRTGGGSPIDPTPFRRGAFTGLFGALVSCSYFIFKGWSLTLQAVGMAVIARKDMTKSSLIVGGLTGVRFAMQFGLLYALIGNSYH